MFHLRTQNWGLRKPQKGSKWPIFRGLNQLHLLGGFFWVVLGGTSPPKPITIMDLGFWVQMNPLNTFLPPLETSNGLKMALNWWFSALYTYWDAILAGSGLLLASKAYIHNGPWVLGPDLPLKHPFTTSGGSKRIQNMPKISTNWDMHLLGFFFWVDLCTYLPKFLIDIEFLVQIYP